MSNGRSRRPGDNGEDNPPTNGNTPADNGSPTPALSEPVNKAIQQYLAFIKALDDPGGDTSKIWVLPPLNPNLSSD